MKGKKLNLVGRVLLAVGTLFGSANANPGYLEIKNNLNT